MCVQYVSTSIRSTDQRALLHTFCSLREALYWHTLSFCPLVCHRADVPGPLESANLCTKATFSLWRALPFNRPATNTHTHRLVFRGLNIGNLFFAVPQTSHRQRAIRRHTVCSGMLRSADRPLTPGWHGLLRTGDCSVSPKFSSQKLIAAIGPLPRMLLRYARDTSANPHASILCEVRPSTYAREQ